MATRATRTRKTGTTTTPKRPKLVNDGLPRSKGGKGGTREPGGPRGGGAVTTPTTTGKPRTRSKPHERLTSYDVTCQGCGSTFTATRPDARYCSGPCRQRAYRTRRHAETQP
jgi:hypothetical protein